MLCFEDKVEEKDFLYTKENLSTMQINVGKLCNLACTHCHMEAGPNREEVMSKDVIDSCMRVFKRNCMSTIDITGGAPEMNPDFKYLLSESLKLADKVIVRTNLTILLEPEYEDLLKIYVDNKIELFASLPCYTEDNTDKVRGKGVFEKSVKVLKILNDLGYGKKDDLVLNLVYNPGGAFLPPKQEVLTEDYRKILKENYDIVFTNLFAITNNPVGRFGESLKRENKYDEYMTLLEEKFNPQAVENMMCRDQVSVSWDGYIYDCDFNQTIDLKSESPNFIKKTDKLNKRKIRVKNHCYACTAGAGSSCGGETIQEEMV